jgi:hypothetical protein
MVTKLQRTEKGVMLLLTDDILAELGLETEAEVSITVRPEQRQIIITPADAELSGIDEEFARHVSDFIEQYRPALKALAK